MIRFDRVTFGYVEAPVLAELSLSIGAGEAVGLFGSNGAGKTTLLRLCMALLQPRSGSVEVAGRSTAPLHPEDLAGTVGYLFQRPEDQLIRTTVREEIAYGPERLGWAPDRIAAAVEAAIERCDLGRHREIHPYDLSLPRRRLVALACVLATSPKVLLLDEPTALLDRAGRTLVAEVIREACAAGTTVLAIVHDPIVALEALDRGVALIDGRIAEDRPVAELLRAGTIGLSLPPAVRAVEGAGISAKSLRMADLAAAVAGRLGA